MTLSRHTLAAGIAALSLALSAAPALAQGGSGGGGGGGGGTGGGGTGGGGGTTTTAQAPVSTGDWTLCPEFATIELVAQQDPNLFANEIGGIGCLIARNNGGSLSIAEVRTGAGWVSTIKSSDPSKLDVQFTWPATGTKHQITVQPGKTVIR